METNKNKTQNTHTQTTTHIITIKAIKQNTNNKT